MAFIALFLLLLFVVILRVNGGEIDALWILITVFGTLVAQTTLAGVPAVMLGLGISLFILYRFGLLARCAAMFIAHLSFFCPMPTEFGAWYTTDFVIGVILRLALAGDGFYINLAGQSLFAGDLLDD